MSKIQEFIDAWNIAVDTKITESQVKINEYLTTRQTAIALTDPFTLKMPKIKVLGISDDFTIDGFDVTTLGQLFDWSYPVDGPKNYSTKYTNYRNKPYVVDDYTDYEVTDSKIYIDGYTFGTMSYLAQQYNNAITSKPSLNNFLKINSIYFVHLDSYKRLKSLGGKTWFDNWMHSLYSVISGTKISVSKLKYNDYSELISLQQFNTTLSKFLPTYYDNGSNFSLGSEDQSKYFQAVLEAGDNFFPTQNSGTQSQTASDYILEVINPLSDNEKKITGKIVFVQDGQYLIPNSTLSGLPNPWTNPVTNTLVPNNTGSITYNGNKSTTSKNTLADDIIINLQNIVQSIYGLTVYLKYKSQDVQTELPKPEADVQVATPVVGPTSSQESTLQELIFNVELQDIFSNEKFGNLFIIGKEDVIVFDDDQVDYSEYVETDFQGQAEIQIEIASNDTYEIERNNAAKQETTDTSSAPIKGSPEFKVVLKKAGYKSGTLEYEFALTIATKEGWLPGANNGRGSRAYRNNNPGNLDYSTDFLKIDPKVTREPGSGSRFARFSTAELGTKALIEGKIKKWASGKMPVTSGNQKLISTSDKYKPGTVPTIAQFMYTYAPPNENNTENYIGSILGNLKKVNSSITRASKVKDYLA